MSPCFQLFKKTHYFILQYSIEGEIAGHMSKAYLKHHIKCIHMLVDAYDLAQSLPEDDIILLSD